MSTTKGKASGKNTRTQRTADKSAKSSARGSGKNAAAGKKSSSSANKKNSASSAMHWRREICGFVFLFLAIICLVGIFSTKALVIRWISALLKGLIGYGFYILPLMLLISSVILIAHHSRPVAARVLCALLVPVTTGTLVHLLACQMTFSGGLVDTATELYKYGVSLSAGGVLSGGIAVVLQIAFGRLISVILILFITFLLFVYPFNMTLFTIIRAVRERPRPETETRTEKEAAEPVDTARVIVNHVAQKQIDYARKKAERRSAAEFDIPVDEPLTMKKAEEEETQAAGMAGGCDSGPVIDVFPEQSDENLLADIPQSHIRSVSEPDYSVESNIIRFPVEKPSADSDTEGAGWNPVVQLPVCEFSDPWTADEEVETVCDSGNEFMTEAAGYVPIDDTISEIREEPGQEESGYSPENLLENMENEISAAVPEQQEAYSFPPITLLNSGTGDVCSESEEEIRINSERLRNTLDSFNIDATLKNVISGPSVTRYELELDRGVKLSKLTNLADDIALALGASGVRIAAIPDKVSIVGIEVPNRVVRTVPIREVIDSTAFRQHKSDICFAVGLDISSNCIVGDIAKLPHLLIAGTTGSGKSVCTNSLIISLLYKSSPEDVKLIMVDPKMVELGIYNGIPHLLIPVVTDPKKAAGALQWAVTEMMRRYKLMSEAGVRDLESYNRLAVQSTDMQKMPKIVVVIDELADLMLVAAKEVEESICRVAQMGRASGIHLIIATQRPSSDVITGLMKANIPSRISFAVASQLESRIILDTAGAEKLVGKGDMLYAPLGGGKPGRVQGCFITDQEVQRVVNYVKSSSEANYSSDVLEQIENHAAESEGKGKGSGAAEIMQESDELFPAAVEVILETGQASVSMLQRRLKLGYARAARIVDEMEEKGIVGPFEGSKPRQLLISREQWEAMQCSTDSDAVSDNFTEVFEQDNIQI